jgi:polar amino acid transport system substrate-binding protein
MRNVFLTRVVLFSLTFGLLITSALVCASSDQTSETELLIVTPVWKTFTEENGSGFYFDLMRLVYEPEGIAISYQITPWARSAILIQNKQADAMLGSYKQQQEVYLYPTKPIWIDHSAVAFKRDKVKWTGTSSLSGKSVGWIRGYEYDSFLDVNMNIQKLINNQQAWKMLSLDRLDFYIDSITDLQIYLKENQLDEKDYALENILIKNMYIRFARTDKGKRFVDIYDQRIIQLQKSGQLKQLYRKWGYDKYYSDFINEL